LAKATAMLSAGLSTSVRVSGRIMVCDMGLTFGGVLLPMALPHGQYRPHRHHDRVLAAGLNRVVKRYGSD
jgi:hypothetical protein